VSSTAGSQDRALDRNDIALQIIARSASSSSAHETPAPNSAAIMAIAWA
jgi:hypothetical protein